MENRLLYLTKFMLEQAWRFLRLPFPGTNVSIGAILFLPMFVGLAVALLRTLFGVGGFAQVGSTVRSYRSYRDSTRGR